MFSFMDNVKKVVSNVQDLAVNVMNELDEGRGSEESPNPSTNISPVMDGPLEKLKKDATAASEMIHNAANLLGEDEVFISVLTKLIKHNVSAEKDEEKQKLFQEWALVHDLDFSLNHSPNSLQRLNELAVEINKSIKKKPLSTSDTSWDHNFDVTSNDESEQVEKLQKELSQKQELIKKFKQRLLEDGKQLKSVQAELSQKIEELSTLKEESSEQLATLQMRIKELEAENEQFQEDTQVIIQQQKEKLSQSEESLEAYKNELEQIHKKLDAADSQLEISKEQSTNSSVQNGELHEQILQQKESLEKELSQKSRDLDSLKPQVSELQESLKAVSSECEKYKKELLQTKIEMEQLYGNSSNEKENFKILEKELGQKAEELSTLKKESNEQLATLQLRIKELETENEQFQEDAQVIIQQQKEKLSQNEESIKTYKNQLEQLQEKFDEAASHLEAYKEQSTNSSVQNNELHEQILQQKERLENELEQKAEELLALKEESNEKLSALQLRIKELEAENDHFRKDTQIVIQQQKEKVAQNEESIESYKNELEQLQRKFDAAASQLETYKEQSTNSSFQNDELNEQILQQKECLENELSDKSRELDNLKRQFSEMQESPNVVCSECEKFEKDLVQTRMEKNITEKMLKGSHEHELSQKLKDLDNYKTQIVELQESLHVITSDREKCKKELLQTKIEMEQLYGNSSNEKEHFKVLEKELSQKVEELLTLKEESNEQLATLQLRIKELEAENDDAQIVIQLQKEKLAQSEDSVEVYKNELEQLRGKFDAVISQFEIYKEQSSSSSVQSNELREQFFQQKESLENELSEKSRDMDNLKLQLSELQESLIHVTSEWEKCKKDLVQTTVQKNETEHAHKKELAEKCLELDNLKLQFSELQESLKAVSSECEKYKKDLLQAKIDMEQLYGNSSNEKEHFKILEEELSQEVKRLNMELKASHDSQAKLQNHIQKLMDNLQAKDDEVSQLAAEMENQAVDGPRAINTVKEMLQTKIKECNAYAEKNEHLKRNIAQYTHQLQEKDQLILELQKIRENLLLSNQHLEKEFGRCHALLEKLTSQSSPSDAATVKKLQDELTLLVNQYNIVKQVCFKMFIDEERGFDHSVLLINLLNYDEKSKNILKEYVTAKYQGTLEGFFKKFNFTSTAQLAQELLKFVDQDIAKSKISLAPVTEPAFQMKVDEALPEPSSDSNDLRNIIQ